MPNRVTLHTLRTAHRLVGQSLLQYLGFASPYVGPGESKLVEVLERENADEATTVKALLALIDALGGASSAAEFPMQHTDTNDLGIAYALRRAATDQRRVAAEVEQLREELAFAPEADALIAQVAREAEARADRILTAIDPRDTDPAKAVSANGPTGTMS